MDLLISKNGISTDQKAMTEQVRIGQAALQYHEKDRPGKIEVVNTKPCLTQRDLSLAYTPGVAVPCLAIRDDPSAARRFTIKGNLVAVVSNGTAVLGLGNIGALASKPVMEGKGVLFKRFADIDVFDIELETEDPDEIIRTVQNISPTFGGINLEDIKAPECFYIEERLRARLDIPVFHDDQHGTAIISGAALLNALDIADKQIGEIKVVICGAGAAGIACANFYISLGVVPENLLMTDSKGVLFRGRGDEQLNPYKEKFFRKTDARMLEDAIVGADVFCGVSVKGVLTKKMVRTMAKRPIILAMANPDPEISYTDAREASPDAIIATGRSDYPNQVNNVLGFPFIFRGALDVEATDINEEMKLAAAYSLARLAKEEVPETVKNAYQDRNLCFGPDYIIPKPFDPRVLVETSSAVAGAAMKSGVARRIIDIDEYREQLLGKTDWSREFMRKLHIMSQSEPKRLVFPEGDHEKIIWAAAELAREGLAKPVLLTKDKDALLAKFEELNHSPEGVEIWVPKVSTYKSQLVRAYYELRQRKGVTQSRAELDLKNYFYYGCMLVREGFADGLVAGISVNFPEVLRPALETIGPRKGGRLVAGMYLIQQQNDQFFFADCAVNVNPNAEDLAEIAIMGANELEKWHIEPRIAMLSFSNFGSVQVAETIKVHQAVERARSLRPDLMIDGPVQPDVALDPHFIREYFPFAELKGKPNLLIFPTLDAGNISLRLVQKFGSGNYIGPILVGFAKPIHLLTRQMDVNNIVNLAAIACVDAQKG